MRQSLGTAVLFGMMGVTSFGLIFTPAFYTFVCKPGQKQRGGGISDVGGNPNAEPKTVETESAYSEFS
jgi:hypothetical protein